MNVSAGIFFYSNHTGRYLYLLRNDSRNTWGIPGGARDSHETTFAAALREAHEEIGMDKHLVTEVDLFVDDHGPWKYETVIAIAHPDLVAHEQNDESLQVEWIEF